MRGSCRAMCLRTPSGGGVVGSCLAKKPFSVQGPGTLVPPCTFRREKWTNFCKWGESSPNFGIAIREGATITPSRSTSRGRECPRKGSPFLSDFARRGGPRRTKPSKKRRWNSLPARGPARHSCGNVSGVRRACHTRKLCGAQQEGGRSEYIY
jgi:hypothetical protein